MFQTSVTILLGVVPILWCWDQVSRGTPIATMRRTARSASGFIAATGAKHGQNCAQPLWKMAAISFLISLWNLLTIQYRLQSFDAMKSIWSTGRVTKRNPGKTCQSCLQSNQAWLSQPGLAEVFSSFPILQISAKWTLQPQYYTNWIRIGEGKVVDCSLR